MKNVGRISGSAEQAKALVIGFDTVYVHTNIKKEQDGSYSYDEIQYSKDEYICAMQDKLERLQLDAMQGTTDLYIAQEENKQLQLDIMQGITDLYMMQASATDNTQGGM